MMKMRYENDRLIDFMSNQSEVNVYILFFDRRYFNIGIGGSDKYAAENERQAFPENDVDGSKFYRPLRGKDSHFRGSLVGKG